MCNRTSASRFIAILSLYFNLTLLNFGQSIEIGTSPNPVGSGARSLGQGNAFIAVADDATAASWNPGGLSQLERPEISFAVEGIFRTENIQSSIHPEAESDDSITFEDLNYGSIVLPFFYLNRNMVFSLNYLKLYGFEKALRFAFDSSNRKSFFDFNQEGDFSVVAPAFGLDLTSKLALGITFNVWNHSITNSSRYQQVTESHGTLTKPSGAESEFVRRSEDEFEVDNGYSVTLGGIYRFSKAWAVASVIKPAYRLNLDHSNSKRTVQTDNGSGSIEINDFSVSDQNAKLRFPWIIGGGIAWRPNDPLTISIDVTWTDWSEYEFEENGVTKNPLTNEKIAVDRLKDTFTFRIGHEYLFIFERSIIPLRFGLGFDPSPAIGDIDKFYTANIGSGLQYDRINFDLAYEFRWGDDINEDVLRGLNGSQDIRRHRVLASLIVYF